MPQIGTCYWCLDACVRPFRQQEDWAESWRALDTPAQEQLTWA